MRKVLEQARLADSAVKAMDSFHQSYVQEVEEAVKSNKYVIVGMKQNPVVSKARNILTEKGIQFKYIEYGSYFSMWKPRLAVKLWSGWPTFPMVFVEGKLIGGCKEMSAYLEAQKN